MATEDIKRAKISDAKFQEYKKKIVIEQNKQYPFVYALLKDKYGINTNDQLREIFGDEFADACSSTLDFESYSSNDFFSSLPEQERDFFQNKMKEIYDKLPTTSEFFNEVAAGDIFDEELSEKLEDGNEERIKKICSILSNSDLSEVLPESFYNCHFLEELNLENTGAKLDMSKFKDGVRISSSIKGCELLSFDSRALKVFSMSLDSFDVSQYKTIVEGELRNSRDLRHEALDMLSNEEIQEQLQDAFEVYIQKEDLRSESIFKVYDRMSEKIKEQNKEYVDKGIACCIRDNDKIRLSAWAKYVTPDIYEKHINQILEMYVTTEKSSIMRNYIDLSSFINDFFNRCSIDVQKEKISDTIIKTVDRRDYSNFWEKIDASVQEETLGDVVIRLFDEYYMSEDESRRSEIRGMLGGIWMSSATEGKQKTADKIPFKKIIDECNADKKTIYSNASNIQMFWEYTSDEFKENNSELKQSLYEIFKQVADEKIEFYKAKYKENADSEFKKLAISEIAFIPKDMQANYIKSMIESDLNEEESFCKEIIFDMDLNMLQNFLSGVHEEEKKKYASFMLSLVKSCGEFDRAKSGEILAETVSFVNSDIDIDIFNRVYKIADSEYIFDLLTEINDGEAINEKLKSLYSIFATNDLQEVFKYFEFFRMNKNHQQSNPALYKNISIEDRDKILLNDLISTSFESNNKQMRNFLDLLASGDKLCKKVLNGYELTEEENAILFSYRDNLINLFRICEYKNIEKSENSIENIQNIKKMLQMDERTDLGEVLLKNFLEEINFDYGKYCESEENIISNLISFMEKDSEKASERNAESINVETLLQEGDLIKGTNIVHLDTHLRSGIRSKEFYNNPDLGSDHTPFDTDFSELSSENFRDRRNIAGIINSTFSKEGYGSTYYLIKKGDYEADKTYTRGEYAGKTRYIRTAIGKNAIRAILTKEWNDEYGYTIAQNGLYIPVIDLNTQEVVFSREQYNAIREKMRGLSFYHAEDFEVSESALDSKIQSDAEKIRLDAQAKTSTEEKRAMVIKTIRSRIPQNVFHDMIGDLSENAVELIDTGSTGRGTNIPGDGDFDFMLKCSSRVQQAELIKSILQGLDGHDTGGTNEYNIRYADVKIEGLDETVDIDVTSERKSLDVELSSDMCVRERLDNIRKNYGDDVCNQVINNIIVAKKQLKSMKAYKKTGSKGATELGGFGGIGVENWILQNGGSFITAMQTFLDNTIDENGKEVDFETFKRKYPIYDFGQNHRSNTQNGGHDHFIEGLSGSGYDTMKTQFRTLLKEYGIEYEYNAESKMIASSKAPSLEEISKAAFWKSITDFTRSAKDYLISDMSRIYGYIAKYRGAREQQEYGLEV